MVATAAETKDYPIDQPISISWSLQHLKQNSSSLLSHYLAKTPMVKCKYGLLFLFLVDQPTLFEKKKRFIQFEGKPEASISKTGIQYGS